jgi:hypothetical protein
MEDAPLVGVRDRRGQDRHQARRHDPGDGGSHSASVGPWQYAEAM